jgi:prepilin-type N-terminal cleavage/methylation domain-containing protein
MQKKTVKGFTLIELLVVVAIIGILSGIGVVAYGKYTTSAKITASKDQHYSVKKFIEASYGQCALGEKYVVMNTCKVNNWSCKGLKLEIILILE